MSAIGPQLPEWFAHPLAARLETTFLGCRIRVHGFERDAETNRPMVVYSQALEHPSDLERAYPTLFSAPLRSVRFAS